MKLLLTCDQVFDRLTRGPFSGHDAGDDAVEDHLAACHECRSLAEALRPAVTLFGDCQAAPCITDPDLPVYRGRWSEVAAPCSLAATERGGAKFQRVAWQMVAAALVGVVVGAMLTHVRRSENDGRKARNGWLEVATASDEETPWTFASLRLSQACRPPATKGSNPSSSDQTVCCTRCHFVHSAQAPPVEISRLLVACLACHGG